MKPFRDRDQLLVGLPSRRPHKARTLGLVLLALGAVLLLFLAWPYAALWQIDRAVRSGDFAALAGLVDLDSVRSEIKQKLNKDESSNIGELSDSFIRWLEEGISALGNQAVERLVTVSWVRARLLDHGAGNADDGFLGQVSYAFFDAPDGFVARIGPPSDTPVQLHLSLRGLHWRVSALYY